MIKWRDYRPQPHVNRKEKSVTPPTTHRYHEIPRVSAGLFYPSRRPLLSDRSFRWPAPRGFNDVLRKDLDVNRQPVDFSLLLFNFLPLNSNYSNKQRRRQERCDPQ